MNKPVLKKCEGEKSEVPAENLAVRNRTILLYKSDLICGGIDYRHFTFSVLQIVRAEMPCEVAG